MQGNRASASWTDLAKRLAVHDLEEMCDRHDHHERVDVFCAELLHRAERRHEYVDEAARKQLCSEVDPVGLGRLGQLFDSPEGRA